MSALRQHLADYLTLRRALGYKLARTEKLLAQFVSHLEAVGASTIMIDDAVAWATQPAGSHVWWALRLSAVRGPPATCTRAISAARCRRLICSADGHSHACLTFTRTRNSTRYWRRPRRSARRCARRPCAR